MTSSIKWLMRKVFPWPAGPIRLNIRSSENRNVKKPSAASICPWFKGFGVLFGVKVIRASSKKGPISGALAITAYEGFWYLLGTKIQTTNYDDSVSKTQVNGQVPTELDKSALT